MPKQKVMGTEPQTTQQEKVAKEIIRIANEYRRQMDENGYVDTPGGIENKDDAFDLILRWEGMLKND